jgi:D-alanyl-D-alanine carboxypeptidase/D-alanyl-D-alanine-endopeptidase (penicillin-binding protein 4)
MKFSIAISSLLLLYSACGPSGALRQDDTRKTPSSIALTSTSPYPRVKQIIDATFPDSLFPPAYAGIEIVSVATGETIYKLNPQSLFNPASNEKLFTSAAALALLGKDFSFSTATSIDKATSRVFIKGSGDPLLSPDDLDSLARSIAESLRSAKSWTVVGDISFFDDIPWGKGWMWDDQGESYNMTITPLSVNANAVTVQIRPGKLEDAPVRVNTKPPSSFFVIDNRATTPVDTPVVPLDVRSFPAGGATLIRISGEMLHRDSLIERDVAIWQPERFAVTFFADRLRAYGIQIDSIAFDTLPTAATRLASISHGLDLVITYMNKESDNLAAENIVKALSAVVSHKSGSTSDGIEVMKRFFSTAGIDTAAIVLADGSGLSRYNLVSPHSIVTLLTAMARRPELFPLFESSLPVAGIDGTLHNRMRGTRAETTVHAKTGSLTGVSSLSGYVRTVDGELLAFSFLMQNFPGSVRPYRNVKDALAVLLAGLNIRDIRTQK